MWVYRDKEPGALDGTPSSGYLRKNRRQRRSVGEQEGSIMRSQPRFLLAISTLVCFAISGCGGQTSSSSCEILAINVSPAAATVDHTAAPPGNTQHFNAFIAKVPPGCEFITGNLFDAVWSVS